MYLLWLLLCIQKPVLLEVVSSSLAGMAYTDELDGYNCCISEGKVLRVRVEIGFEGKVEWSVFELPPQEKEKPLQKAPLFPLSGRQASLYLPDCFRFFVMWSGKEVDRKGALEH